MTEFSPDAGCHLTCPERQSTLGNILVIGYGNELRSDDGVGPRIAREVAKWRRPGVRALACRQLCPELVDELAQARRALFVDAGVDLCVGEMTLKRLAPITQSSGLAHVGSPAWLLALNQALHGSHPSAWLLTLGAARLALGEELSQEIEQILPSVIAHIQRFLDVECCQSAAS